MLRDEKGRFMKGFVPWNKGRPWNDETKKKISGARLRKIGKQSVREPFVKVLQRLEGDYRPVAYILGVLHGDGWLEKCKRRLCLRVTSKVFALKFANALKKLGMTPRLHIYKRQGARGFGKGRNTKPQYDVRTVCDQELIDLIETLPLFWTAKEKLAYLEGLYDSEGYYGKQSIYFYNADPYLLRRVQQLLQEFGITAHLYHYPSADAGQVVVCRKADRKLLTTLIRSWKWSIENGRVVPTK
jgi:hypothetical protein